MRAGDPTTPTDYAEVRPVHRSCTNYTLSIQSGAARPHSRQKCGGNPRHKAGDKKCFHHLTPVLSVQSWSPFVTLKSGHIWRTWAEITQTLMPESTKKAQIHLPECTSARQISAKIPPKFAKICAKFPPNFAKLAKFRFTKGL